MDPVLAIKANRYLIVDDDEFTCQIIANLLNRSGATEVRIAGNGAIASSLLVSPGGPPDTIICDLNMPELDGVELMMHLSRSGFTGDIVLISGSSQKLLNSVMRLSKAHRLNVIGTLNKPIKGDELLRMLANSAGEEPLKA